LKDFIYEIKKPLATALSQGGKKVRGRDAGGEQISVQYKTIWNCQYESPLYNKYILIKNKV
jgi:hypothetical protein